MGNEKVPSLPVFWVVIPARMGSTRFPGKMLAPLGGVTVLARTYHQACLSRAAQVAIATDHPQIADEAKNLGALVFMTDPDLPSGTDRCAAALSEAGQQPDFIVNVQGDEPFINPDHINQVAAMLAAGADIATLCLPIVDFETVLNPNIVKIALRTDGYALLFSRSPIPYSRQTGGVPAVGSYPYLRHLGIYGFQTQVLKEVVLLEPSPLERTESLEQLRWLEAGYSIKVGLVDAAGPGIDTPDDLLAAERWLASNQASKK